MYTSWFQAAICFFRSSSLFAPCSLLSTNLINSIEEGWMVHCANAIIHYPLSPATITSFIAERMNNSYFRISHRPVYQEFKREKSVQASKSGNLRWSHKYRTRVVKNTSTSRCIIDTLQDVGSSCWRMKNRYWILYSNWLTCSRSQKCIQYISG